MDIRIQTIPLSLVTKKSIKFSDTMNFKIVKSLALINKNISNISKSNIFLKNLFGELGIFLIENK